MNEPQFELDPNTKQILTDLKTVSEQLQVPILLVGARARGFIFDNQYGVEGRATTDWDVAVKLDSWELYDALVNKMTTGETALFKKTRVMHKFIHLKTQLEVDVIPFGNISNERQEITWNDGNIMSVLGFEEAFSNTPIETIDDITIRIVPLTAFMALKLLAWNERRANKDLEDIIFILENYYIPNRDEEDRMFREFNSEIFEENKLEFYEAAIALLGRDISKIFSEETINKVKQILAQIITFQTQYLPGFISKNLDGDAWDKEFDRLVRRLEALQYGLENTTTIYDLDS
ncbi:hypothetical protein Cri9333_4898 (plasmid) [Crinalium epipsammum PCC 9333]|uniref:Nucleotidyltransferase n=1 Tax=Crinalium epipsammum PCC 9333 TaxID=1173022 RepID=K9W868_9CYAN|nr:nucleotidyl transferase AbiEii/AbiGii toxin family protein [Crinalium epipsammum]AFZ15660.1 hypothetical protein Cri9333_4898 [Crinalium epipsammum PCC 9333]